MFERETDCVCTSEVCVCERECQRERQVVWGCVCVFDSVCVCEQCSIGIMLEEKCIRAATCRGVAALHAALKKALHHGDCKNDESHTPSVLWWTISHVSSCLRSRVQHRAVISPPERDTEQDAACSLSGALGR